MHTIDKTYLPFSSEVVQKHLAKASGGHAKVVPAAEDSESARVGVRYYEKSAKKYHEFSEQHRDGAKGMAITAMREPRQIEKDERFWTAGCLLKVHGTTGARTWRALLQKCFGDMAPVASAQKWDDLLREPLELLLEAPMPSPRAYNYWLRDHVRDRHIIPYVFDAARTNPEAKLEGFTHADAVLVSEETGFAVIFEAKVCADISYEITFDLMRNQIARYVDVILEQPTEQAPPLSKRDPKKTLFALLTPRMFKENWRSRLYGRLMHEYWEHPETLLEDLPHRRGDPKLDCVALTQRVGWLTWEDCNEVLPGACPWLHSQAM